MIPGVPSNLLFYEIVKLTWNVVLKDTLIQEVQLGRRVRYSAARMLSHISHQVLVPALRTVSTF